MAFIQSDLVTLKYKRGKGRGVFARQRIEEGTVIERVPVLTIPTQEIYENPNGSKLANYAFEWSRDSVAIALGYGSMYNHSYQPNARYEDEARLTKVYIAIRRVEAGEEITINYNGDPENQSDVGFDVIESDV